MLPIRQALPYAERATTPGKELNGRVTVKGIGRFGGEKKLVFVLSK